MRHREYKYEKMYVSNWMGCCSYGPLSHASPCGTYSDWTMSYIIPAGLPVMLQDAKYPPPGTFCMSRAVAEWLASSFVG